MREKIETLIERYEIFFNLFDDAETLFDNLGPSLEANVFRVDNDIAIYNGGMPWFTGTAVVLFVINVTVGWFFHKRYLNSWDAYFIREKDRLCRIHEILDSIKTDEKNKALTEALNDQLKTYFDACDFSLEEEAYQSDAPEFEKTNKKKRKKKPRHDFAHEFFDSFKKLGYLKDQNADSSTFTTTNNIQSTQVNLNDTDDLIQIQEYGWRGLLTEFPQKSINHYTFHIALSYTLSYWLVNFYTVMAVPVAPLLTPLTWALLALSFPMIYLIFKEIQAYRTRLITKNSDLPTDILDFRRGWLFIALVLSISLALILTALGYTYCIAWLAGGCLFIGSLAFVYSAFKLIDQHLGHQKQLKQNQNDTEETSTERKKIAQKRRQLLDNIALIAYQLKLQTEIDSIKTNLPINDNLIGVTIEEQILKSSYINQNSLTPHLITFTQKISLPFKVFIGFLNGFGMGSFIGWVVLQEFLAHLSNVFIIGTGGIIINFVVAMISISAGIGFAQREYTNEKIRQDNHQTFRLNNVKKSEHLAQIKSQIKQLREELANYLEDPKIPKTTKITIENIINYQFVHPIKKTGMTFRKAAAFILNFFKILANLSCTSFIIRAIAFMALSQAICSIPGVPVFSASLMLFGAATNPVGIAVVTLILFLCLIKSVRDVSLMLHEQKEDRKLKYIDSRIKYKEIQKNYLTERKNLLFQTNKDHDSAEKATHTQPTVLLI